MTSPPWLSAPASATARDVIADIARALERPPPPIDGDVNLRASLLGREPGLAMFYAYLDLASPARKWPKIGVRHLDRAIARVPYISIKPFYSYGFSGTAWAVEHLRGWFIDASIHMNDQVDGALLTLVEEAPTLSYDLQYGLVGFGLYALERLPHPSARTLLERIVARLDRTAEPRAGGLSWRTPNADWVVGRGVGKLMTQVEYAPGVFNGVAGVVGLLAAALRQGIAPRRTRRLLDGALSWLWRSREDGLFSSEGHLTWISGSLGIASVVFAAARAARLTPWERRALALARRLATGPEGSAPMRDPSLGAGAAGAAHMFRRLHLATGERCFAVAARLWLARLLRRRRPGVALAGFPVWVPAWERRYLKNPNHPAGWVGAPGLLSGVAGIGLMLLSVLHGQEPWWDRALLLSHR